MLLPFEHTPASAQASSHCPPGPESAGRLQCYRSGCVAIGPVCLCPPFLSKLYSLSLPPLAPNSAQPVFQACLHLTSWLWGLCPSFKPCCQAQPAEALDPVTCPKHDFPGVRAGVLLSGRFACRALEKGSYTTPCPPFTRLTAQVSPPGLPCLCAKWPQPTFPSLQPCSVCLSIPYAILCSDSLTSVSNPL